MGWQKLDCLLILAFPFSGEVLSEHECLPSYSIVIKTTFLAQIELQSVQISLLSQSLRPQNLFTSHWAVDINTTKFLRLKLSLNTSPNASPKHQDIPFEDILPLKLKKTTQKNWIIWCSAKGKLCWYKTQWNIHLRKLF